MFCLLIGAGHTYVGGVPSIVMNIANALKHEISRVARKELKDELASLRKLTTAHRSAIAALKREIKALHVAVKAASKAGPEPSQGQASTEALITAPGTGRRPRPFNAEQLAAHRAKLGFTQAQMAQVIGVSALSVYKWESGKVTPRAAQLVQIQAAIKLGKRASIAKLRSQ